MDNTLILSLTAMLLGFAGIAIKICFASKCTSVEVGCIKVHRNVEIEPIHYDDDNSKSGSKQNNYVREFNEKE